MKFFGIGSDQMKSVEKRVAEGGLVHTIHGLRLRQGDATIYDEVKNPLHEFFERLTKEAEPHASKVVRLTTGLILKDDDDNVELPSSYTKRTLYSRWCWDRGWDIKPKGGAGSYGRVQDYSKRVNKPDSSDGIL